MVNLALLLVNIKCCFIKTYSMIHTQQTKIKHVWNFHTHTRARVCACVCACVRVWKFQNSMLQLALLDSTSSTHTSGVPGEIKRSRDLRGGRWSWTLTFAQKRSWVGRWSWAEQVGHLLLRVVQVVRQQRCNGHCLSDSVQHSSWKSNCAVHKSLGNGEGTPP